MEWVDGWTEGIGNKAQLRPAKAGAGAWPELGKNSGSLPFFARRPPERCQTATPMHVPK